LFRFSKNLTKEERVIMKMVKGIIFYVIIAWLMFPANALCESMSNDEIAKELRDLKGKINKLEEALKEKDQEIEKLKAQTVKREEMPGVIEEMKSEDGPLAKIMDHIQVSGLIEVGAARENVSNRNGTDTSQSDLNLTTVELTVDAEVNEWTNASVTLLYEDATFGGESGIDVDQGTVTIGNTEKFPLYFTGGAMYVPFGALLTHFPDDPLVDQPLTLLLGETREKAALVGLDYAGFSLSGYVFNGDMEKATGENHVENFGFDAHYEYKDEKQGLEILIGAAYINSIAESDGLEGELGNIGVTALQDFVGGFNAYLHTGYCGFFFDAEFMTATDHFLPFELATGTGAGAQPSVWNLEGGYNWNWGRNLEIALKYAESEEAENLGFPEKRYGLALNQTLWEGVILSVAYLHDEYHINDRDGRDDRNALFSQLAIEF
jgi:hypothetical protein